MNNSETENTRCAFASKGTANDYSGCKILTVSECDGLNMKCGFYKTKAQLITENDRSIERHRRLGICVECKYHSRPCKKSDEV